MVEIETIKVKHNWWCKIYDRW